jgi:hypothetical protein
MMSQTSAIADTLPWYRQVWPWFLISLPASAVIGGIITIIIAVNSADPLVVDNYYKEGLAINQEIKRRATAAGMELNGLLRSDGNQVTLALSSISPLNDPQLKLQIVHATRPELDRKISLERKAEGQYAADMPTLEAGIWYMQVENNEQTWEIRTRIVTQQGPFQALLKPGN